jgi:hypothetical protein
MYGPLVSGNQRSQRGYCNSALRPEGGTYVAAIHPQAADDDMAVLTQLNNWASAHTRFVFAYAFVANGVSLPATDVRLNDEPNSGNEARPYRLHRMSNTRHRV